MRTRIVITVCVALVLIAATVIWAVQRRPAQVEIDPTVTLADGPLLVRDTRTGHLAVINPDGQRRQSSANCVRAYAAAGRVLCLGIDPQSPTTYQLAVLDDHFQVTRTLPINGLPTRTRISADGRMLSFTVFVSGDSYLTTGFSTRSGILDLATDVLSTSLEDFTIDDQKPPADANFWGTSFAADDNTFYATMSTGEHLYLVQGDFAAESITVLDDGVECPSLSPDGTRLVYKKRMPDRTWQLWVYELASKQRHQLAEPADIDDQAAWIDDSTIMYAKRNPDDNNQIGVWSVPADGSGEPTLLAPDAESPAPLR